MENIPSIFHPLSDSPSGEQEANGWGEPANRENRPSAHSYGRVPHTKEVSGFQYFGFFKVEDNSLLVYY